jgi:hypothetical protein
LVQATVVWRHELRGGFLMPHTLERLAPAGIPWVPTCVLCGRPVELETCKTDERGKSIHEQCYLRKIRLKHASERVWHSHLSVHQGRAFASNGALKS